MPFGPFKKKESEKKAEKAEDKKVSEQKTEEGSPKEEASEINVCVKIYTFKIIYNLFC